MARKNITTSSITESTSKVEGDKRITKTTTHTTTNSGFDRFDFKNVLSILELCFLLLLLVNILKQQVNGNFVSFTDFLVFLQNFDPISISEITSFVQSFNFLSNEWAVLDGLRQVLALLIYPMALVSYLVGGLLNVVFFLIQFLQFILI